MKIISNGSSYPHTLTWIAVYCDLSINTINRLLDDRIAGNVRVNSMMPSLNSTEVTRNISDSSISKMKRDVVDDITFLAVAGAKKKELQIKLQSKICSHFSVAI